MAVKQPRTIRVNVVRTSNKVVLWRQPQQQRNNNKATIYSWNIIKLHHTQLAWGNTGYDIIHCRALWLLQGVLYGRCVYKTFHIHCPNLGSDQAPVPLSIFRSNSKFDENSKHSSVKYTRQITTIFCTRHDSVTVVTCAKYRCDRSYTFYTRVFWIFIEFRIRSKYA